MSTTPVLVQNAWWGRNDNGTETTATFKGAQGSNWTQDVDTKFRIRFRIQETAGGAAANRIFQLQRNLAGGGWVDVTGSSLVVQSVDSTTVADAATTTTQMTGGTGAYIGATAFDDVNGAAGGNSLDMAASGHTEVEFCVQILSADVTNGQEIQFQVTANNLASWPAIPTVTVSEAAFEALTFAGSSGLNNWTDPLAALRQILVGLSDSAANLNDPAPRLIEDHFLSFPDDAANLADALNISQSSLVALLASLPADQWANLADVLASKLTLSAALPDDMATLADLLAVTRGEPAMARLIVGHRAF